MRAGPLRPQDKQGPQECAQGRWGHKGAGALMLRAQPLGPYWGRGTYVAGTAAEVASRAFGRARNLGCAQGRWGRKIRGVPQDARMAPGAARYAGYPRMRAWPPGTQYRRGSRNARREAAAAKSEGYLEFEEGGSGHNMGGVAGMRGGRLRP